MHSALRFSVIGLLLAAVAGCGQMGPLYLPADAPAGEAAAPAAEPSEPAAVEPDPAPEDPAPALDATGSDDDED